MWNIQSTHRELSQAQLEQPGSTRRAGRSDPNLTARCLTTVGHMRLPLSVQNCQCCIEVDISRLLLVDACPFRLGGSRTTQKTSCVCSHHTNACKHKSTNSFVRCVSYNITKQPYHIAPESAQWSPDLKLPCFEGSSIHLQVGPAVISRHGN